MAARDEMPVSASDASRVEGCASRKRRRGLDTRYKSPNVGRGEFKLFNRLI